MKISIMTKLVFAACLGLGSMNASAAAFYVIQELDASPITVDGITLSFSAPNTNEEVTFYEAGGTADWEHRGIGIRTGSITYADRIKNGEVLRLNFDTTVDADTMSISNWDPAESNTSVTLTTDTGATLFLDIFDDLDISPDEFALFDITSLGAFDYIDITGGPEGVTFAGMNGVNEVVSAVPVPAAAWLFGSALFGLTGISRRKSAVSVSVA